jgi:soluble lytic murein transglycosylase-like protein
VRRFYLRTATRTGRVLGAAALLWLCAGAAGPARAGSLYRFIDERGVIHYTNVSYDQRYQRVRPPGGFAWSAVSRKDARRFDGLIRTAAANAGVPAAIVKAVIHAESAFATSAVSRAGAMGLMQLMPGTAAQYRVTNAYDPAQNIRAGVAYLKSLLMRFGNDVSLALAAYNAGPGAVEKYGRAVPPYKETRNYVSKIRANAGASAGAEPPKRIFRTVEIVDGREVVRYSDKAAPKGAVR